MKFELAKLGTEPFVWRETVSLEEGDLSGGSVGSSSRSEDIIDAESLEVRGRIRAVEGGEIPTDRPASRRYLWKGSVRGVMGLRCSRCLERYPSPLETQIELLVETGEQSSETDVELETSDLDLVFLGGEELDTRPHLVEQVLLEVPMKPVCRDDCRGLCGRCGADLNQGPCDCRPEIDPRWQALAGLKKET